MKFSVIIPTFNSSGLLPVCLDSILNQTYHNIEVCIIDGKSTDDTLAIVAAYEEKGLQINKVSEKDNGIYDAMNKGIEMAIGDWIIFMGSDDSLFEKDLFEKLRKAIIRKQDAKVWYGNARINGTTGWAKDGALYDGEFNLSKLLNKNICHQAVLYHRDAFKEIGNFDITYTISSDWDFNLRCWAKHPFKHIPITISNFNAGGLSSNSFDAKFAKDFVDNICAYFNFSIFHPLLNSPTFIAYNEVLQRQKKTNPFRYYYYRLMHKFNL